MRTRIFNAISNRKRLLYEFNKPRTTKPVQKTKNAINLMTPQPQKDEFVKTKTNDYIIKAIQEQLD